MAYTNATFYLDYETGSDAARTALTSVTVANNGSGLVRCTKTAHGLVTGAIVDVTLNYAGAWKVTRIDADNFDLVGSTYSTSTAVTVTPRGGASLADAWKTITTGVTAARQAAGDTIRIKASPDPTSLGQTATWTDGPQQATRAIVSSTNATPIVVTLSSGNYTLLAPAVGDTVIVNGHTTNTNANGVWAVSAVNGSTTITLQDAAGANSVGNGVGGASGTVRKATNMVVKLTSAVTQKIALCGNQGQKPNWTPSANVTSSVNSNAAKEGAESIQIVVAAAFTTGLAAYFPTGTLDLSGYQQVSFWVNQSVGTLGAAGAISLKLCTDAAGATPVHTLDLPAFGAVAQWCPVVVDLGSNMNSAIASIGLYINTDNGAQTINLDNIIACKASSAANSLNLTSLIGKNSGSEAWFGIQSINGTRVMLDATTITFPAAAPQRGYSGTTETVTTYKRETIKIAMLASGGSFSTPNLSGAAGSLTTYSGGWDRTAMTSQSGETWWDGQIGLGYAITDGGSNRSYLAFDKINFTRYNIGFNNATLSLFQSIGTMSACNCTQNPLLTNGYIAITTLTAVQCGSPIVTGPSSIVTTIARADGSLASGFTAGAASSTTTITQANNNAVNGVNAGASAIIGTLSAAHGNGTSGYLTALGAVCNSVTANTNLGAGISNAVAGAKVMGGSTTGNVSGVANTASGAVLVLRSFTANEATAFAIGAGTVGSVIYSEKNGGVADAHLITTDGGTIISATDQRHTASGIAWKFRPTSTVRNATYPLSLAVAKVACAANVAVNVTIYTRRDSTNIIGTLKVKGGQLAGVASDVTVTCAPTINTWTQSSNLTITPTEAGVVEITYECYDGVGTSNSLWIDDLAVS